MKTSSLARELQLGHSIPNAKDKTNGERLGMDVDHEEPRACVADFRAEQHGPSRTCLLAASVDAFRPEHAKLVTF